MTNIIFRTKSTRFSIEGLQYIPRIGETVATSHVIHKVIDVTYHLEHNEVLVELKQTYPIKE